MGTITLLAQNSKEFHTKALVCQIKAVSLQ